MVEATPWQLISIVLWQTIQWGVWQNPYCWIVHAQPKAHSYTIIYRCFVFKTFIQVFVSHWRWLSLGVLLRRYILSYSCNDLLLFFLENQSVWYRLRLVGMRIQRVSVISFLANRDVPHGCRTFQVMTIWLKAELVFRASEGNLCVGFFFSHMMPCLKCWGQCGSSSFCGSLVSGGITRPTSSLWSICSAILFSLRKHIRK